MILIEISGSPQAEKDRIAEIIASALRKGGREVLYTEPIKVQNKKIAVQIMNYGSLGDDDA